MKQKQTVVKPTAAAAKQSPVIAGKQSPGLSLYRTADQFSEKLMSYTSTEERKKIQSYFKSGKGQYGDGDIFIGVRMGQVFALAKDFIEMPMDEIEKLLESPIH